MTKDSKETDEAVCLLEGKKVYIEHRGIEIPGRPGDFAFLRIDSWNCDRAQDCDCVECRAKTRNGTIKNWSYDI